ncbi:DUF2796 domain-containing protein [Marinobacter salinisoli]|uniref:DUF2796 domain-containing protein n=1 Tax=Marinobacter salinisoli TaxID=2769486 RepID=A0ABX7MSL4_9GAMM|nr:DUF2796 domain-containing protein [Marinobacter salinisoli]QSP95149.1 DUF2796 domain-containing protein [Marinobacter salinisoli]
MKRSVLTGLRIPFALAAALCSGALATASERAHVHGHGTLQFVIENSTVDIAFSSPAGNLLGFEHQAHTPEETRIVDEVQAWLSTTPLIDTPDERCTLRTSEPDMGSRTEHDHHGHNHDDEEHRDIHVSQSLECPDLSNATALKTPLLRQYPGLQELDVMWVTPSGQSGATLTNEEQAINLAP